MTIKEVPSFVDLDKLEQEVAPAEIAKYAPPKLRGGTIAQTVADVKRSITEAEAGLTKLRGQLDDLLRFAG